MFYLFGLAAIALVALLLAVNTPGIVARPPATVAPTLPPVVASADICPPGLTPYSYARSPVNKDLSGPTNDYKESEHSFGPSALPVRYEHMTPAQFLAAVRSIYVERNCRDKRLFQVGYMALDVHHLARGPHHPDVNPNSALDDRRWQQELEIYFGAIRWDLSRVDTVTLPTGSWSLMMVQQPDGDFAVKAVEALPGISHVLVLAVTQPDGTVAYDRRRLECGFQPTYKDHGEVPVVFG
jgi:hypothetical protein